MLEIVKFIHAINADDETRAINTNDETHAINGWFQGIKKQSIDIFDQKQIFSFVYNDRYDGYRVYCADHQYHNLEIFFAGYQSKKGVSFTFQKTIDSNGIVVYIAASLNRPPTKKQKGLCIPRIRENQVTASYINPGSIITSNLDGTRTEYQYLLFGESLFDLLYDSETKLQVIRISNYGSRNLIPGQLGNINHGIYYEYDGPDLSAAHDDVDSHLLDDVDSYPLDDNCSME